uniref:Ganglioside GM2 activator n=1 Tax=Sphenodon punctatus TaxID=8508 RepID=A0A8D0GDR0_SPHPU
MQALPLLALALCALQLCPAVLGGKGHQRKRMQVGSFSWQNCGGGQDPAVIRSMSIQPDPINIPGDITVSIAGATSVTMRSPLAGDVVLEKQLGGGSWIKVPCVDNIGTCKYDDLCDILDRAIPPGTPCPEPLRSYGIPCHCPFKAGSYALPTCSFYIPNLDLPSWLTNGNYRFQVVLSNGGYQIACLKLTLSLQSN